MADVLRISHPTAKVEVALNGYEGLLKIGTFRPHLLVLDLRLPDLDGCEVSRRVKTDPETTATKILAVTGYASDTMKQHALQCGADDFLAKPFNPRELGAEANRLITQLR